MSNLSKQNQHEAIDPAGVQAQHDLAVSVAKWERSWLYATMIILAALFVAAPAFQGTWLWDDDQEITANAALVHMKGWDSISAIWNGKVGADYLPLKSTILWLEYQLWGANHVGYHLATTLFHLLNALLIWKLFRTIGIKAAWIGGLLFAIHPILVESVAWVSEQKNTLSLAFLLPSMICYLNFDRILGEQRTGRALCQLGASILLFTASLLCKSTGVMMPFTLLLYTWWKHSEMALKDLLLFSSLGCFLGTALGIGVGIWKVDNDILLLSLLAILPGIGLYIAWTLYNHKKKTDWQPVFNNVLASIPFFLIAIAIGIVTIDFQHRNAIGSEWIPVGGYLSRTLGAGLLIFFYTYKTLIPFDLCPIYPKWDLDPEYNMHLIALYPLLFIILGIFWWQRRTWGKHLLFGYGFFLIYLIPVLGFVTMSYMRITWAADHFLYVPVIGLIALATIATERLYHATPLRFKKAALTGFIAIFCALTGYAHRYSAIFLNEADMWTYTLHKNFDAWQAHSRYGKVLLDSGKIDNAFFHIYHSNRLRPDLAETNNNMGVMMMQKNRAPEAIPYMQKAVDIMPDAIPFRVNLANLLANTGHDADAIPHYQWLLQRDPRNPMFHNNYAMALYQLGRKEEALLEVKQALQLDPNMQPAIKNLELIQSGSPFPGTQAPANRKPR